MSKRAEFLNPEAIRALTAKVRFLELFQKTTWPDYLGLLVQLYDTIEERGSRIPYSEALDIIERFYFGHGLQAQNQKNFNVITLLVTELGLLRESFDSSSRFVDTTRDGKQLLHWIAELSRNRPQYTGTGAETLISTLQQLASDPRELTLDEAIGRHKESILRFEEDIARIRTHGVQASELLNAGVTVEELYQRADEEASRILLAADDVKLAIEVARRELTQHYLDSRFSAGDAIEFVADYTNALRGKPEYQSYRRAKEILSHIDGLGALSRGKGVEELIRDIEDRGLISRHVLQQSSIYRFAEQFQAAISGIEEKYREQLYLLKVQVQYALHGTSRQTREDLMALHGLLLKEKQAALTYLDRHPHEVRDALPFEVGVLEPDPLEKASEAELPGVTENGLGSGTSDLAIVAMLRQSEEATVERVLKRLQGELDHHEIVELGTYPIRLGLAEYYVLSRIECFSRSILATPIGFTDVQVGGPGEAAGVQLIEVPNFRYELPS